MTEGTEEPLTDSATDRPVIVEVTGAGRLLGFDGAVAVGQRAEPHSPKGRHVECAGSRST
ncbi:hypothetical protein ACFWP5_27300 [Streptomyces sp. NPDC058469]|uniref:hypothetical protein n=1 Tax=Streptomyces sp. NPDC058469 TaxID=3346514 RepID=UPI003656ADF5